MQAPLQKPYMSLHLTHVKSHALGQGCAIGWAEKLKKKRAPPRYGKTNFKTNFGLLPIKLYQQPTPSGQKW